MKIRFLNNPEVIYDLEIEHIDSITIQFSGEDLPQYPGGFEVVEYDEDGEIYSVENYHDYSVIYDIGDTYIQYTSDENVYNDCLFYDDTTGFVTAIIVTPEKNLASTYLVQSGQGKTYKEFSMELFDENQYPIYRVIDGELTETSMEERRKQVLKNKLSELSGACQTIIETGTDVTLSTGTKHYSFTLTDQNNITSLFTSAVLTKKDGIPYHANGELCELYSYMDIVRLNKAMQEFILYNTTYFNMLKAMVSELSTIDEIKAVVYGTELNDDYVQKMTEILTQSQIMFANTLTVYGISLEELTEL